MILSDEPGYYKTGQYGIRIENLLLVEERDIAGAEGEFLGFEVLTLAPIERALVDQSLLSRDEILWWNAYHAQVLAVVGPLVDGEAKAWLQTQCKPFQGQPL
jgi:Xaa-Pro aminopeptidase